MLLIEKLFIRKKRNAAETDVAAEILNFARRTMEIPSRTPSPITLTGKIEDSVTKGVARNVDKTDIFSNALMRK